LTIKLPEYELANVLVVGDVMLDRYWQGVASRISPEAPVPVVKINQMKELPGAAANVALNITSLNAHASLLSFTGDDSFAVTLENLLLEKNIDPYFKRIKHSQTITKLRVLSQHQQLIRLDFEESFPEMHHQFLLEKFQELLQQHKFHNIIFSDYGKGTLKNVQELIQIARLFDLPMLVDPKGDDYSIYKQATLLTPNRKEFETIVGVCRDENEITEKALKLINELQLSALLVTRGAEGMSLIQPNHPPLHLPAKKQEVYDVTGAGDTVIGILSASLAAGKSLEQSVVLANIAAGIVVKKLGAATVSVHELRRALFEEHAIQKGISSEDKLLEFIQDAHAHGETVVMTNGCFDILHPGHIVYLEEAKKLGDHLIVAVNSDESVKKLKGSSRPINPLQHRMLVLAGLASVDWVVSFSEKTPERLIQKLLPDILVKGGDYHDINNIAGAKAVLKNGGQVKKLSFVEGYSTSKIVKIIEGKEG
jgi:D-beta-D-heptose 7-phosphate kinase/D-beta-D-heptose 1-phosphate adenosyltransferase